MVQTGANGASTGPLGASSQGAFAFPLKVVKTKLEGRDRLPAVLQFVRPINLSHRLVEACHVRFIPTPAEDAGGRQTRLQVRRIRIGVVTGGRFWRKGSRP
jgi:hypothetical protein